MSTLDALVERLTSVAGHDSDRVATYVLTGFMAVLALMVLF